MFLALRKMDPHRLPPEYEACISIIGEEGEDLGALAAEYLYKVPNFADAPTYRAQANCGYIAWVYDEESQIMHAYALDRVEDVDSCYTSAQTMFPNIPYPNGLIEEILMSEV